MYRIQFHCPCKIHFIGIGGISMSGLAEILLNQGFTVTGSDERESALTDRLAKKGVAVHRGHRASNVADDTDIVVYTAAVKTDNPEYRQAEAKSIPILTRAELLGQLMENYAASIGVAGTHGKTTTTSMLSQVLLETDLDPTITIGGILPSIGGNIRIGKNAVFVTEACEYTNSFLSFLPNMEIILNIEADHLDFFKDIDEIRASFRAYMEKLPADGVLVINGGINELDRLTAGLPCRVITFGAPESGLSGLHYSAADITYDEHACASFGVNCTKDGQTEFLGTISLNVPGLHNVYNALSVIALVRELHISMDLIRTGLSGYQGTKRRFEKKGILGGITIIDDYAHHPDEIRATLTTACNYPHNRIWCIFQPHTYTRTKALMNEFAKTLALADEVILADIYPARETDTLGVSSSQLKEKIIQNGTNAHHFSSFDEIEKFILENCINGDLLITMGAGDIVKVGESLLGE